MTDSDRPALPAEAERAAVDPIQPASEPAIAPAATGTDWWGELKAIFWLVLAVLAFHSFVAKPFYIPSESMMPTLLKGDRLVVSKYPFGWSWVSPSFHVMPRTPGRLLGALPERGDIVIVTPPGGNTDYIKRVIALPGDRVQMIDGQLYLNGTRIRRERRPDAMIPMDDNINCSFGGGASVVTGPGGQRFCRMQIFRETLPNGRSYDTADTADLPADDFPPEVIPPGHVWLMGDNRDHSADSRFPAGAPENGLGGPVAWENIGGRAEFLTFSLDGSSSYYNPISWFTAFRGGRAGTSLHPDRAAPAR